MTASATPDWNIAPLQGLSQVKGRTDAVLSDAPIHRFLLDTVQRFPERPAVAFREQGVRWTWARWRRASSRWACAWATAWASGRPTAWSGW